MILLVDNSNSRTKFMMSSGSEMCMDSLRIIPTAELTADCIRALVPPQGLTLAVIASVVPHTATLLQGVLQAHCPVHMLHADTPGLPVEFDYPGTATLGADRVANIVAVATHYSVPCIAIDAGTAVTFDVVLPSAGERPRFVGGAIAPGMRTMLVSMNRDTALLPHVQLEQPMSPIGRTTGEAMQAGVYWGACGMVDCLVQQMQKQIGETPFVIATGGDASKIASAVKKIDRVDEWLTFRGLLQVAKLFT